MKGPVEGGIAQAHGPRPGACYSKALRYTARVAQCHKEIIMKKYVWGVCDFNFANARTVVASNAQDALIFAKRKGLSAPMCECLGAVK